MVAVHQRGAKETLYFPLCHHHGTIPPSSSTQQNVEKDVVWWWLRTSTTETTRQTNKSCFPIFCLKKPTILFLLRFVFFKEGRRGLWFGRFGGNNWAAACFNAKKSDAASILRTGDHFASLRFDNMCCFWMDLWCTISPVAVTRQQPYLSSDKNQPVAEEQNGPKLYLIYNDIIVIIIIITMTWEYFGLKASIVTIRSLWVLSTATS